MASGFSMQLYTLFCITVVCLFTGFETKDNLLKSYTASGDLYNLQVHNGFLYIGGTNRLLKLDAGLNVTADVPTCQSQCSTTSPYINKVLVIKEKSDELFTCNAVGNNNNCEIRSGSNLSITLQGIALAVSSDRNRPVRALFNIPVDQEKLHVVLAATYGDDIELDNWNPMRVLSKYENALRAEGDPDVTLINKHSASKYLIYYKAANQFGGYNYFATNQKAFANTNKYVSKLIRICDTTIGEIGLVSYTDVIIQCSDNGVDYTLIQDIAFVDEGNTTILVATFAKGTNPEEPDAESVLCSTSLQNLNNTFKKAIKEFIQCNAENTTYDLNGDLFYISHSRGQGCSKDPVRFLLRKAR